MVTHGNGPQVGLLALQAAAYRDVVPYPLDVLGAESEGMIGYLLEQALRNELPGRPVATLLTQIVVDPTDPAFAHPSKPIGPVYSEADARRLAAERGWAIAPDGDSFRRVVASPEPLQVVELEAIRLLVAAGVLVICAGGGGIPVVVDDDGRALRGRGGDRQGSLGGAARAPARGGRAADADRRRRRRARAGARPRLRRSGGRRRPSCGRFRFAAGSMAPKVEAACRFVEAGGRLAAIGALDDAARSCAARPGPSWP